MSAVSDFLGDLGLSVDDEIFEDEFFSLDLDSSQGDMLIDADCLDLLTSMNDNLTNINLLLTFLVTVGFAVLIVYIIIRPVFYFFR